MIKAKPEYWNVYHEIDFIKKHIPYCELMRGLSIEKRRQTHIKILKGYIHAAKQKRQTDSVRRCIEVAEEELFKIKGME